MKTIDFNFDNVGGLSQLYLIEAAAVTSINTNVSSGKVRPVVASNASIYNIKVYGESFRFSETMSIEDSGNVFDVIIEGFIPRLDNLNDVARLERGRWIAMHQDANGNIILSGSRDIPLRFVSTKDTGSTSSRNATGFRLLAKEPEPSRMAEPSAMELG